jgi:hypothetical protein
MFVKGNLNLFMKKVVGIEIQTMFLELGSLGIMRIHMGIVLELGSLGIMSIHMGIEGG